MDKPLAILIQGEKKEQIIVDILGGKITQEKEMKDIIGTIDEDYHYLQMM